MAFFEDLNGAFPILRTLFFLLFIFLFFQVAFAFLRKRLNKYAKTRKQKSNVAIFSRVLNYTLIVVLVLVAIFSYSGSWTGVGVGIGLLTAVLGFALQKPITGIAAWFLVVSKRLVSIGDRIMISNVKGNVKDITLTHILLEEVGMHGGEEVSGRIVIIPNNLLFENNLVNYSLQDDYVMAQVSTVINYESDLDRAIKLITDAVVEKTKPYIDILRPEPQIRVSFTPDGVEIKARAFVNFGNVNEVVSDITKEIYYKFKKEKNVEFAYPHREVIYKKKLMF
ncbi:MAG: mechanosensitive ion channel family protein [Candidatus Woesearchaeota archaeon]|nr:MAG: mechanosensitive ion channel family protein [Candidatus Woesearchaeota archaeon]